MWVIRTTTHVSVLDVRVEIGRAVSTRTPKAMIERHTIEGLTTYGAYSQAVKVDLGQRWMILLSGQLPLDPNGEPVAPGDVGAQAQYLFPQIERLLEAAGASMDDVVKAQIFVTDMTQFAGFTEVRDRYFGTSRPISTLVEVTRLVTEGCDIEIEVMAIVDKV